MRQGTGARGQLDHDECIHILEGEVEIAVDGQPVVRLCAGDLASFTAGSRSTWTVHTTLRKFFVISG